MSAAAYRLAPLVRGLDLAAFDCGEPAYNFWLTDTALRAQESDSSRVYVLLEQSGSAPERVVGYFAICPTTVVRDAMPEPVRRGMPRSTPGWLLAKLALDTSLRAGPWGRQLLREALDVILDAADRGGGAVIVVDPDNERLVSFYARSGFTGTGAGDLRMFVKVATVRAHLRPPSPWASMSVLLGDDLLSTLVGVSPTSLHSYRSRERPAPDQVGVRLHFVALVVADLTGSYNDVGVRRWFDRPRAVLDGQAPRAILTGDWSPDDEAVRRVRDLAHTLPGPTLT